MTLEEMAEFAALQLAYQENNWIGAPCLCTLPDHPWGECPISNPTIALAAVRAAEILLERGWR